MTGYAEFLASKQRAAPSSGIGCVPEDCAPSLFGFQRHITAWAVRKGPAAASRPPARARGRAPRGGHGPGGILSLIRRLGTGQRE